MTSIFLLSSQIFNIFPNIFFAPDNFKEVCSKFIPHLSLMLDKPSICHIPACSFICILVCCVCQRVLGLLTPGEWLPLVVVLQQELQWPDLEVVSLSGRGPSWLSILRGIWGDH